MEKKLTKYIAYIQDICKEKEIECSEVRENNPHNSVRYEICDESIQGNKCIASIIIKNEQFQAVKCELYGFIQGDSNNKDSYVQCTEFPIDYIIINEGCSDGEIYEKMCKFITYLRLKLTELGMFELYEDVEMSVKIKLNMM